MDYEIDWREERHVHRRMKDAQRTCSGVAYEACWARVGIVTKLRLVYRWGNCFDTVWLCVVHTRSVPPEDKENILNFAKARYGL